jgi:hypothetical protein
MLRNILTAEPRLPAAKTTLQHTTTNPQKKTKESQIETTFLQPIPKLNSNKHPKSPTADRVDIIPISRDITAVLYPTYNPTN